MGFCAGRLGRIDAFLREKYVEAGRIPCADFVLTQGGRQVHRVLLGHQDVGRGVRVAEDTVYRIYSMTKPVTCVALMTLVEEGRIALDDAVVTHIPEWAGLGVFCSGVDPFLTRPLARPMQVVDLLRHTAGLTYGFQNRTNVDACYRKFRIADPHGPDDLDAMIGRLAWLPLEFSPGEAWNYSVATDVAGYLVQKIAGCPLSVFLAERIFEPLGMIDTGFHVRADQRARFAACYNWVAGGMELQDDPETSAFRAPPRLESGGGGLVSTTADYLRFLAMLLGGGVLDGVRILGRRTLGLMVGNHLPGGRDLTELSRSLFSESTNAGIGFGLGFATVFDAKRTLTACSDGEYFWGGAASTAFWVDPAEDITAVFMTQLLPSSTYPIRRELRTMVYAALE